MAIITVGGTNLPSPSDYKPGIMDIVKSDRNAKGDMIGEKITQKQKLELGWKSLTAAQLSQVLTAVKTTFFFSVTYLDPKTNSMRTATFYAGDTSCGMFQYNNGNPIYVDVKFNLIEK